MFFSRGRNLEFLRSGSTADCFFPRWLCFALHESFEELYLLRIVLTFAWEKNVCLLHNLMSGHQSSDVHIGSESKKCLWRSDVVTQWSKSTNPNRTDIQIASIKYCHCACHLLVSICTFVVMVLKDHAHIGNVFMGPFVYRASCWKSHRLKEHRKVTLGTSHHLPTVVTIEEPVVEEFVDTASVETGWWPDENKPMHVNCKKYVWAFVQCRVSTCIVVMVFKDSSSLWELFMGHSLYKEFPCES